METETTRLITEWGGNYVTWATCERCGQSMQYHTDRSFNYCPYCGKRVIYEQKEENKWLTIKAIPTLWTR